MKRREVVGRIAAAAAIVAVPRALWALVPNAARGREGESHSPAPLAITVYKSATCGCCTAWVKHMTQSGFVVTVKNVDDVDQIAEQMRVPKALWACHTAVTGRYVISGHVPGDLVRQLLREAPSQAAGIGVPGMPAGSPGMESPTPERYQVIEWRRDGSTRVYASR